MLAQVGGIERGDVFVDFLDHGGFQILAHVFARFAEHDRFGDDVQTFQAAGAVFLFQLPHQVFGEPLEIHGLWVLGFVVGTQAVSSAVLLYAGPKGDPSDPDNQARFIAYRAEWLDGFAVWNLCHEYSHYLDGRYTIQGTFSNPASTTSSGGPKAPQTGTYYYYIRLSTTDGFDGATLTAEYLQ